MLCYALLIIDNSGVDVGSFCALRAEVGELELNPLLYIFHPKTILSGTNYQLVRCFLKIHEASYRDRFLDFVGPDRFTTLSFVVFWWLIVRKD